MIVNGYHKNPRRINATDLESLEKSLKEFGDLSGITINKGSYTGREMELIGGNVRAGRLGINSTLDVVWTEEIKEPGKWGTLAVGYVLHPETHERFAVRLVDWPESMCDAANIAANAEGGKFDFEILANSFPKDLTKRVFEKFGGFSPIVTTPNLIDREADLFETSVRPTIESPIELPKQEPFEFTPEPQNPEPEFTEKLKPSDVNPLHFTLSATDVAQIANQLTFLKEYHNIESNSELFMFLVEQWFKLVKPQKNEV